MDENLQDIENLFRDSLGDNEEMPSPHVWNGINNILDKDDITSLKKKYNILKSIALLLLFLVLGLSIYELSNHYGKGDKVKPNKQELSKSIIINPHTDEVSARLKYSKKANDLAESNKGKSIIDRDNRKVNKNSSPIDLTVQPANNPAAKRENEIVPVNASHWHSVNYSRITAKRGAIVVSENKSTNSTKSNQPGITGNFAKSKYEDSFNTEGMYNAVKVTATPVKDNEQPVNTEANKMVSGIENISGSISKFQGIKKLLVSPKIDKIISHSSTKNRVELPLKKEKDRVSIIPFFSADFAWYNLEDDDNSNQVQNAAEIEKAEKDEFSSSLGMLIEYKLNASFSFQSGITYSNTNIAEEPKILYAQPDNTGNIKYRFNTSSGYGYVLPSFSNNPSLGDSLYALASINTLKYISIPVAVKYTFIRKGKLSFNTLAGMSVNFLTRGQIETTVERDLNKESEIVKNIQGLKKIYLNGLAGLGMEYSLSKRIGLNFDPTFRFALNSVTKNVPQKSYPKSIGLSAAIKIVL